MARTILKANGERVELSQDDLVAFDKAARRRITKAKRNKTITRDGDVVRFKMEVRGMLPQDLQGLLRSLLNIQWHGKAYAPEESSPALVDLHRGVDRSHAFDLPVKLDLNTGELTIDWFPPSNGVQP